MKTILIIEDEKELRDLLGRALDHEGFQVLTAENGKEGVKLAEEQHPDLILSDIQMYPTNGYETLEKIRMLPSTRSIPFILMTAEPSLEGMRQGMNAGADDYLSKPFRLKDLKIAIESRFRRLDSVESSEKESRSSLVSLISDMKHMGDSSKVNRMKESFRHLLEEADVREIDSINENLRTLILAAYQFHEQMDQLQSQCKS